MLDEKTKALLEYICSYCGSGYKIITLEEMASVFKPKGEDARQELISCVKTLINSDYISSKYFDGEQFCLCSQIKGKEYLQSIRDEKLKEIIFTKKIAKVVFISSFLASILGGVITAVLSFILRLC